MRLLLMPALLLGQLVMSPLASAELLLGVGKADVTGIIAQSTMVGFADPEQIAAGLHTRLWARAFVATDDADPSQTRVAFVSADIGMPAQAVRMEVARVSSQASCVFACGSWVCRCSDRLHCVLLQRLGEAYPDGRYSERNV